MTDLNHTPFASLETRLLSSTASLMRAHTGDSSHILESNLGKDGKPPRLLAVSLSARDLLSGSADKCGIVLELASFETPSGYRRTIVGWHGPFATEQESSGFLAQLAKQPPTVPIEPNGVPLDRNA